MRLADELAGGPPAFPVWLYKRSIRPGAPWDQQVVEAIRGCEALLFLMSQDSVRDDSTCKPEWVRALRYKKPVIPLLLDENAEPPLLLETRQHVDLPHPLTLRWPGCGNICSG